MRGKLYYIFGVLALVVSVMILLNTGITPRRMTNNAYNYDSDREKSEKNDLINSIYDFNLILSKMKADDMPSFVPKYEPSFYNDSEFYAGLFGVLDSESESVNYISDSTGITYENSTGKLTISSEYDYIHFELYMIENEQLNTTDEPFSPLKSVDAVKVFLEERFLPLSYSDALVTSENNGFTIVFLSKLNGTKNYSYPVVAQTDNYGNVIVLNYYAFDYERLNVSKIKTMKEAAEELPTDRYEDNKIDLKSCELVYYFENSIVQPGYLFQGEIAGIGGFKCFIKASKYE